MRCTIFLIVFSILYLTLSAQTWQKAFNLSNTPQYLSEEENGILNIHCYDFSNSSWYKVLISAEGDSLGVEYYEPIEYNNYYTFEPSDDLLLSYWTDEDSLLWEQEIEVPYSSEFTVINDLAFLYYFQGGVASSFGTLWVYNKYGELKFQDTSDGTYPLTGWSISSSPLGAKSNGDVVIGEYSSSTWTPQGIGGSYTRYKLLSSDGEELCFGNSNHSSYGASYLKGIAKNGMERCGTITDFDAFSVNWYDGQQIPCTNYFLPHEYAIPNNIEMIGLHTDGFGILGTKVDKTVLTRIDCAIPYEELCLYTQKSYLYETVCEGNEYIVGDESFDISGDFEIMLTDVNGCDSIVYLSLMVETNTITINPEIIIVDGTGYINLYSNCPNCEFLWSNGETEENIANLEFGFYAVTITDSNNCSSIFEFNLELSVATTKNEIDTIEKVSFRNICNKGENIELLLNEHYNWSDEITLKLFDTTGKCIDNLKVNASLNIPFQIPEYSGLYFLQIIEEGKIIVNRKMIVL